MQKKAIFIAGTAGSIEAVLHLPDKEVNTVGIICHPNPQQGGTMDNKVVTTVAKAFNNMGFLSVRFNYRGVGQSDGHYGNITGEVEDCLSVVNNVCKQWVDAKIWLAGFSFGAYIAAYVAQSINCAQLITIAPAVDRMPFADLGKISCPWIVIQGEDDEVVAPGSVYRWFDRLDADKKLVKLQETGHFFHGRLIDLQQTIQKLQ